MEKLMKAAAMRFSNLERNVKNYYFKYPVVKTQILPKTFL
jgi:hypothetical protein